MKCRWCPLEDRTPYRFMDIGLFERIVNEMERLGAGYFKILLFRGGEPFLYPDIRSLLLVLERTDIARRSTIEFYSNGMIMREDQARAIVDSPLRIETIFSVDGIGDKESFEFMREGAEWDRLRKNVHHLSEMRKGTRYEGLKRISSSTIIPHAAAVPFPVPPREEIMATFEREFRPIGVDTFYYRGIHRWSGEIILDGMPVKKENHGTCFFVRRGGISILVDGKVSSCCADMPGHLILGDLTKEALETIYYGEEASSTRESMVKGDRISLNICCDCDHG